MLPSGSDDLKGSIALLPRHNTDNDPSIFLVGIGHKVNLA